ncbi:MAG: hypothetical protein M1608_10330 [Candidatus Omnitrophica bacterium]|nr:hypothetical protein [Candidatus Omnitrophota bacterium]
MLKKNTVFSRLDWPLGPGLPVLACLFGISFVLLSFPADEKAEGKKASPPPAKSQAGAKHVTVADLKVDPAKLPPVAKKNVDFTKEIKPILKKACMDCHGGDSPFANFRLTDRKNALKGGDSGPVIIPGKSAQSVLIYYVSRLVPDMEMPPDYAGNSLTKEQVGLLRAWIDQGAKWE